MGPIRKRILLHILLAGIVSAFLQGCGGPQSGIAEPPGNCICCSADGKGANPESALARSAGAGALLATRFESLEELKSVVRIEYFSEADSSKPDSNAKAMVRLTHCSRGRQIVGILESGLSQKDIMDVKKGDLWDKVGLVVDCPFAVINREDLQRVYILARREPWNYGEGDVAFYDLAEFAVANITTPDLAYQNPRDSTEKGYINSFNHITAQAFISTIFSEEMADFVADVHERKNMAELITGKFSPEQLSNPDNNPVENYVDIVNNEWGQELGKDLREKYQITRETQWSPELMANYLNDLQRYYSWAFQIGFKPCRPEDEVVVTFANKINLIMRQPPKTG